MSNGKKDYIKNGKTKKVKKHLGRPHNKSIGCLEKCQS